MGTDYEPTLNDLLKPKPRTVAEEKLAAEVEQLRSQLLSLKKRITDGLGG